MKMQFIYIYLSISIYPSATDLVPICLFYFIKTIHSYGRKKSNTRWRHFATTLLVYTNKRCLGYFCTSCCFCGCNLLSHYFVVLAFVRCIRVYILCVNGDSSSKLYSNELLERFFVLKIGSLFWRLFWRRFEGNKFWKFLCRYFLKNSASFRVVTDSTPVWQDLASGSFLGWFSIWQNFGHTLAKNSCYCSNFHCFEWPNIEQWSKQHRHLEYLAPQLWCVCMHWVIW